MKKFEKNKLADKLFIQQLCVAVLIGVLPEERQLPQNLLFDLEIEVNAAEIALQDNISLAVDYSKLRQFIIAYAANSQFQLIETLASHLATELLKAFSLRWLRLSITKKPFDMPDTTGVGIIIERSRVY
jgi:dihydroneopterin aldolase